MVTERRINPTTRLERGRAAWDTGHWLLAALVMAALGAARHQVPSETAITTMALILTINAVMALLSLALAWVSYKATNILHVIRFAISIRIVGHAAPSVHSAFFPGNPAELSTVYSIATSATAVALILGYSIIARLTRDSDVAPVT